MKTRPNVLIVYPDQMREDAMGCSGNPCIRTPNVDRLAAEGVRFENAFTSFPLCSPFRASLFTGKYAHANGQLANHFPVPLNQDFLPEIMRDNGYRTGYIGKWHLYGGEKPGFVPPGKPRLGFDHFVGFNRGHYYFGSIYYRDTNQPYHDPRYEPEYQTDQLIEFMDSCVADGDAPFFAMICYGPPHPPLEAPERYLNMYAPEDVPLSPSVDTSTGEGEARRFLARYYGLITAVDDCLGRVLGWLDGRGIAEDTLVILVSDHGEMAGEYGLYGKKRALRSSMQVPLIVRYPRRFGSGRVVPFLVDASVDTMPTILEICGIPIPVWVQGVSYLPVLGGSTAPTRDEVFYEIIMQDCGPESFPVPERGLRTLSWLYVRTKQAPTLLFDLKRDPDELENLAGRRSHDEIVAKLDGRLRKYMEETGDDWDLNAEFPPPNFMTHEEGAENAKRVLQEAIVEQPLRRQRQRGGGGTE